MYDYSFGGIDQSVFIETAKQLLKDEIDLDSFIAEMIKTHFQEADIEIIQKMLEWAEYPMLEIVDTQYLIKKEIDYLSTYCDHCNEKIGLNDCIKCNRQKVYRENLLKYLSKLISLNVFLSVKKTTNDSYTYTFKNWITISNSILMNLQYFNEHEHPVSYRIQYHIQCTKIIHSLWSKRIEHNTESLTYSVIDLSSQLQDLTDEVQRLKRKNEALEYQLESKQYELRRLTSKVNKIEHHLPTEIVEYDYDAIKERLDPIRDELNIVQRTFRRIIHAQYKVPIAVLVGKN